MKKLQKNIVIVMLFSLYTLFLNGCNNGTNSSNAALNSGDFQTHNQKLKSSDSMTINFTLDGEVLNNDIQNWKDMGWHLLTLTVSSVPSGQQPIPVQGIYARIGSPLNPEAYGEKVEVQDINCSSANFSQVNDSCSAYVKVSYDYIQNPSVNPQVTVNFAAGNTALNYAGWIQPKDQIYSNSPVGIYRPVTSIESKYYSGSNVQANPTQYAIILLENGSLPSINVSAVGIPKYSQYFEIIHRTIAGNDPYYGNNKECSTSPNLNIDQIQSLSSLNDSCIIIYKTHEQATQADIYDSVTVDTTASTSFPYNNTSYTMHAHYTVDAPIPNQGFNAVKGNYTLPANINHFQISYNFTPNKLPLLPSSNGAALLLSEGTNVWNGEQILTNLGAPSTINSIRQQYPNGLASQNSGNLNGQGWATASGQVYQTQALTRQGQFNITLQINSDVGNSFCPDPQNINLNIPFSGYNQQIYTNDCLVMPVFHTTATLSGSCDGSWCNYQLALTVSTIKTIYIPFSFSQPTTNIVADLTPSNSSPISFAAQGGQSTWGAIGTAAGQQISQSLTCDSSGTCNVSGNYNTGEAANTMSYVIGLNSGDVLNNGMLQYTRSSGYSLNSFVLQNNN